MGIIYYFVKPLIRWTLKIFFKKIYLSNEKNVPDQGPVIYAVNHPTAFIDPIAIGSILKPTLHFMLRGDMFKSPIVNFFLGQINTIPIFRFRDGFASMKNNVGTMDKVYQKLNEGRNILILAEGQTKHEKKMRPIQKGAARMAFGAFEKFGKADIRIVPVGVNYTDSDKFRSTMMIDFGPAIPLDQYLDSYKENPRKAIKELTEEVSDRMRSRIIHIDDGEKEPTANVLLAMKREQRFESLLPIQEASETPLKEEWELAEKINNASEEDFARQKVMARDYQSMLSGLGLSEAAVAHPYQYSLFNTLTLIIGFIPFLVGLVLNILPIKLAEFVANKKVKKIEFHSSLRIALSLLLWPIYFGILAVVLMKFGWSFWMILSIPFLGYFAVVWRDLFLEWNGARSFKALPDSTKKEIVALRKLMFQFLDGK